MNSDTIEELERFWQIQEQALGKFSPEVAITISKLANMYFSNGDFDRAELLHKRALDIHLRSRGSNQSDIDDVHRCLELVQEARENAGKGKQPSIIADNGTAMKEIREASQVPQSTRPAKSSLGAESLKEMELEVTLLRQMVGPEHPSVADSLTKLADLYCRSKLYAKMEPILLDALRIRENTLGPEHQSVATELKNIGQLYFVQERYSLAEPLFRRALDIRKKVFGTGHPKVLAVQECLARLLRKTNHHAQAEELERYLEEAKQGKDASLLGLDDQAGSVRP
jgi:tetratricopeptide (TPR) repeat protein